jgi:hypothetical protein
MRDLYGYDVLIEQFITRTISISEFEKLYSEKFLNETIFLGDELFHPLDYLFAEVNLYTGYPLEPDDDPDWYISEAQLRQTAAKTLEEIRALP